MPVTPPTRAIGRVAVIGASESTAAQATLAEEVGRRIAEAGWVLYTGGLGGVMEAASRGARAAGGRVIGILPGNAVHDANPYVEIPIVTGMGHARNVILVQSVDGLVAIGGGPGTLSEIAVALKVGRPVVGLGSWEIPGVEAVDSPAAAIAQLCGVPASDAAEPTPAGDPFMERLTALCRSVPGAGGEELAEALRSFDGSQARFLAVMRQLGKHHEALGPEVLRDLADLHRLFTEREERGR